MSNRPLLVQFGAGNIGRSLVGQLFSLAGWEVIFLDVADSVIDALNQCRGYQIQIKDETPDVIEVRNVSGVSLKDRRAVLAALARADLAGTSVGPANLESVCALLADSLPLRNKPLSVLLCENLHHAAAIARGHLEKRVADKATLQGRISFVEAAISKMVPTIPAQVRERDPLVVWAEAYNTLYLDADACIGEPPAVPGVAWRRDFPAYVDRKLFLHNFGHAAAAYFGFLAGKTRIWQCMEDPAVRSEVAACMMEAARGLASRHAGAFTFDENRAWADDLLRRFGNRSLDDTVFRVGRDLNRKYARDDRMIGALRLLRDEKIAYPRAARAAAAGLFFAGADEDGKGFPGDGVLVAAARDKGVRAVLAAVGGLDPDGDSDIIAKVSEEYDSIRASEK